jgi:predicted SAM-dependent methyltransferase
MRGMKELLKRLLPPSLRYRLYTAYLRFAPIHAMRRRQLSQRVAGAGKPLRLIVGAASTRYEGWIPTDEHTLDLLNPADWSHYFQPNSIDAILAEHVWEHLTPVQGRRAAQHCFTYLKPGGYLRLAVPDGYHPDPTYIEHVKVGGSGPAADDHKVLYTYPFLADMLTQVGFRVEPLEYFDADGKFHAVEWNPADGMVQRSARFDARNKHRPLSYTSLAVDARKPH